MVDVSDPSSSSDVPNILSHAYLHSAATASGGAGAPALRLQYADGGESGDGGGGGDGGGMKTPRPHHAWQEPKSGRATGAYNPLYASDAKGVYTGRGVYTASPSVPDAGVLSSRLHALSAAAVAPIAKYDQQRTVNTERRAAGSEEQRAGAKRERSFLVGKEGAKKIKTELYGHPKPFVFMNDFRRQHELASVMPPALTPAPACALLAKMGVGAAEVNKSVMETLRTELVRRVQTADRAGLEQLLLQLPRFMGVAELRAVPDAVLARYERDRVPLPAAFRGS